MESRKALSLHVTCEKGDGRVRRESAAEDGGQPMRMLGSVMRHSRTEETVL